MSTRTTLLTSIGAIVGLVFLVLCIIIHESATTATPIKRTGNARNDKLLSLDPTGQASELEKITRHRWEVTKPFYMGMPHDSFEAFWSFHCTDGRDFVVEVGDDPADDKILNCDLLFSASGVRCFETFEQQEAANAKVRPKKKN